MLALEAACAAIVGLYVFVRLKRAPDPARVAGRLAILVAASWLGEDSVIRVYGFYHYSENWSLIIDQVPLAIVVIWPVVIDSAWQLARYVSPSTRLEPLVGAAFVLADASLIEPIAVQAGLWHWTEPGLFAVPPVGILGWALFAVACLALVERWPIATILVAPLATHTLLLASWWCGLRWVSGTIPIWAGVAAAWIVLAPLAGLMYARGIRRRVPAVELYVRVPGALFFFALLALHGRQSPALLAWSLAFAPPYLALLSLSMSAPLPLGRRTAGK